MIPNQFPSPGSDLVSSSIADYLWLLMEAHQLSLCTSQCCGGDGMEQMSYADQICFKDIQPQREGQELSSLPVPDQPNTKYSSCKSRHIFKVVAVGEWVRSYDASRLRWSHRKKKSPNLSISFFSSKEIYIIPATLISLFHRRQKGYLRTGVQPRLQTSVESVSLLPVKRN